MDKRFLESCLAEGMSLEQIGNLTGKHPSTVAYWINKHGLKAVGHDRHAPKGGVDEERLKRLIAEGASLRAIARELGVSFTTVRHWVGRLGLETQRMKGQREAREARERGLKRVYRRCKVHGHTAFFLRSDGLYRCAKCRSAAVAKRRRTVKRQLVEEAGGCCAVCGYDRYDGALHFHHLDPETKEFMVSRRGITRSIREVRVEAGKCVLVCANCHAEVEAGLAEVRAQNDS